MRNIAIYLIDQKHPVLIFGEGMAPADLLVKSDSGVVEGLSFKINGSTLVEPEIIRVPFAAIQRLAISTFEGERLPGQQ